MQNIIHYQGLEFNNQQEKKLVLGTCTVRTRITRIRYYILSQFVLLYKHLLHWLMLIIFYSFAICYKVLEGKYIYIYR